MSSSHDFKRARIRRLSRPLAEEVNPQTLEAMRLANVELSNRVGESLRYLRKIENELCTSRESINRALELVVSARLKLEGPKRD